MAHPFMTTRRTSSLLLLVGATVFGGSCATMGTGLQDDDRPPVVVSSGSVDFDPTDGTFEQDGNARKWKNKGKGTPNEGQTVRFEVEVANAVCSPSSKFGATDLTLFATNNPTTERVVIDIQGGDLTVKSSNKSLTKHQNGKKIGLQGSDMMSLVVSEGADKGTVCGLTKNSKITINQKAK